MLSRTRELERELGGVVDEASGSIVLGASMSVGSHCLPPLLSEFRTSHPGVKLQLDVATTSEHAVEGLRTGVQDLAVIVVAGPDLDLAGMEVEQVGCDEIVLVTKPGAEPHGDVISRDEFARLSFVTPPTTTAYGRLLDRCLREAGVMDSDIMLHLGHPDALKQAVRDGLGVAMLMRATIRDELAAGSLRQVRVEGVDLGIPIAIVHREGKVFSGAQHALISDIRTLIGKVTGYEAAPDALGVAAS
jgi:DNA-binding transcriptional LysR family regulator